METFLLENCKVTYLVYQWKKFTLHGVNNILGHRFAGPFSNLVMQEEVQFFQLEYIFFSN